VGWRLTCGEALCLHAAPADGARGAWDRGEGAHCLWSPLGLGGDRSRGADESLRLNLIPLKLNNPRVVSRRRAPRTRARWGGLFLLVVLVGLDLLLLLCGRLILCRGRWGRTLNAGGFLLLLFRQAKPVGGLLSQQGSHFFG
jgi:hypothetical protein